MPAFLFSPLGKAGMALLAIGLIFGAGYVKGRSDAEIDTLKDTVKAHENRKDIDEAVGGLDAYSRCIELGGLPDRCVELRGLEAAPKPE